MSKETQYDVAITFAGEDRSYADDLASSLKARDVSVFYDTDEAAELWGEDLYSALADVYENRARFCVMFISKNYSEKEWTTHERRAIQARALRDKNVYLLPIRLDGTPVPGVFNTTGHITWPPDNAETSAELIKKKLAAGPSGIVESEQFPEELSILSVQKALGELYGDVNAKLGHDYLYGYLSRSSGYLRREPGELGYTPGGFVRPISWLLAIASSIGINVETEFIAKYPGCCPHCLESTCICMKTGKKPRSYVPAHRVKETLQDRYDTVVNSRKTITFDFARKTIASIYPSNEAVWRHAGPWFHFAKIHEEVAEVHEALSRYVAGKGHVETVSEEVADVLAWLLGAWDIALPGFSVDDELKSYYFRGCPVCENKKCSCPPRSSRPERLFDPAILMKIRGDLANLFDVVSTGKIEVEEMIKSIDIALASEGDSLMRLALGQVKLKLDYLLRSIPADENEGRALIVALAEYAKSAPRNLN